MRVDASCHVTPGYHNGLLVQQAPDPAPAPASAPAPAGAHMAELATQRALQDSNISAFPATSSLSADLMFDTNIFQVDSGQLYEGRARTRPLFSSTLAISFLETTGTYPALHLEDA
jgi:hypothetical protein